MIQVREGINQNNVLVFLDINLSINNFVKKLQVLIKDKIV